MENFILSCHWNGRFGNRMHQYAYGATYKKLHNVDFYLPSDWEGTYLFKNQTHKIIENDELRLRLNQTIQPFNNIEYRKNTLVEFFPNIKFINPDNVNECYINFNIPVFFDSVCAYNQCIFDKMDKQHLLNLFEFSDEVKNSDIYKRYENVKGTYDIAHLRRDDISSPEYNKVNAQGYSVISKNSYINAFKKFGYDSENVLWTSDDFTKKWHTSRNPTSNFGWQYPMGSNYRKGEIFDWLEDFLRLYFARTIFRANSSFSWWAAFLSPTAKVYSPILDKKHIYGVDGMEEIEVEFVDGNHPHWLYGCKDILIK